MLEIIFFLVYAKWLNSEIDVKLGFCDLVPL